MASANGLQNNSLVVATIDGLTTIYATVYTNGGAIDPTLYVKYTANTNNTDLGTFDFKRLEHSLRSNMSSLSLDPR